MIMNDAHASCDAFGDLVEINKAFKIHDFPEY